MFFEYRISSNLSFEEDIVKSARRGIVQGVGIRAVKGDQIGFAFTEDLTLAEHDGCGECCSGDRGGQCCKGAHRGHERH